jgi:hypothetical protein
MDSSRSLGQNEALDEYSREYIEADFWQKCEELNVTSASIPELELRLQTLSCRLIHLKQQTNTIPIAHKRFAGSEAQIRAREWQLQLFEAERVFTEKEKQRDSIAQTLRRIKSVLGNASFPIKPNPPPPLTRDNIITAIKAMLRQPQTPNLFNRLKAVASILGGDYQRAAAPLEKLMAAIGEKSSLHGFLEERKKLYSRDMVISRLASRLVVIRQRYDALIDKKSRMPLDKNLDTPDSRLARREMEELQDELRRKTAEASQAAELRLVVEGLRTELEPLEKEIARMEQTMRLSEKRVDDSVERVLMSHRAEVALIEESCERARRDLARSDAVIGELSQRKIQCAADLESAAAALKKDTEEYEALTSEYDKLLQGLGCDPFVDDRFAVFMREVDWQKVDLTLIRGKLGEHQELAAQIAELNASLKKKEQTDRELNEAIEAKRERVAELEQLLRAMFPPMPVTPPQHVRFPPGQRNEIGRDETAILIQFRNLRLEASVSIASDSNLCLAISLLEAEKMSAPSSSGDFGASVMFVCRNDVTLRSFIETSPVVVRLYQDDAELGRAELTLSRLCGAAEFSSSAYVTSNGERIGTLSFDAGILVPLTILPT